MSEAPPPPGPPPSYSPYLPVEPAPTQTVRSRRRWFGVVVAAVGAVTLLVSALAIPLMMEPTEVNLDGVESFPELEADHTDKEVDYDVAPPVGGRHNSIWLDCGVYDEPVPNENAVHDLEHGTVWVTYRPGLNREDVDALAALLPQNGILSPYADLEAPVVVTVWGTRLLLEGADDPRLGLFIAQYGSGETAPEPMTSCAGGERNPPAVRSSGTSI